MFALDRVKWDINVGEIRNLILVQVAFTAVRNPFRLKEVIDLFYDGPFKRSALGAAQC